MPTATVEPPAFPTEERLGRQVEVDPEQERLDAEAAELARAIDPARSRDYRELFPDGPTWARFAAVAEACGRNPTTDEPYYTPRDVASWQERADTMRVPLAGMGPGTVERLARLEIIPNARLREAYEARRAEGDAPTLRTIESALPSIRSNSQGFHAARLLGLRPSQSRRGDFLRWYVSYENAVALARVLDLDYQEVGV